ncbi:hypothetical protein XNC1_1282 [Xenorhabdus nematophila ATCC 19061]|uniref:Uncharacterized protein n=1 Tax=Xenorhabdus nematophila (strain ATCC 19061 / DSM 3370 / CCUG 14189 / LMG 1036 / NCIMB 9965 / AN6) TaxID=406817 RepID=D3V9W5_XENNA|nr:hypothetical protein XNC1_1282 [Xenorhabdus nematophila ATCC 19061]
MEFIGKTIPTHNTSNTSQNLLLETR